MPTVRNSIYHSIVRDKWGTYIPLHADTEFYDEEFGDQHYIQIYDSEMKERFAGVGRGGIGPFNNVDWCLKHIENTAHSPERWPTWQGVQGWLAHNGPVIFKQYMPPGLFGKGCYRFSYFNSWEADSGTLLRYRLNALRKTHWKSSENTWHYCTNSIEEWEDNVYFVRSQLGAAASHLGRRMDAPQVLPIAEDIQLYARIFYILNKRIKDLKMQQGILKRCNDGGYFWMEDFKAGDTSEAEEETGLQRTG